MRSARHQLLSDALSDQCYDSLANVRLKFKGIRRILQGKGPDMSIETLEEFVTSTPQEPHKFATIPSQEANSCSRWIATNDVRYRGASLRSELSMRHKDKPPPDMNSGRARICIQLKVVSRRILAERSQNDQSFQWGRAPKIRETRCYVKFYNAGASPTG